MPLATVISGSEVLPSSVLVVVVVAAAVPPAAPRGQSTAASAAPPAHRFREFRSPEALPLFPRGTVFDFFRRGSSPAPSRSSSSPRAAAAVSPSSLPSCRGMVLSALPGKQLLLVANPISSSVSSRAATGTSSSLFASSVSSISSSSPLVLLSSSSVLRLVVPAVTVLGAGSLAVANTGLERRLLSLLGLLTTPQRLGLPRPVVKESSPKALPFRVIPVAAAPIVLVVVPLQEPLLLVLLFSPVLLSPRFIVVVRSCSEGKGKQKNEMRMDPEKRGNEGMGRMDCYYLVQVSPYEHGFF
mmetsp:Transcript_115325/g.235770  ORF Transcript_115325/g.235770 Transcript_115325/m.235770 type:complete len:299 (-) Transcript_115325:235-1131(-)